MGISAKFDVSSEGNALPLGTRDSNGRVTIQNLGPNECWIYTSENPFDTQMTMAQKATVITDQGTRISAQQTHAIDPGSNGVRLSEYFLAVTGTNAASIRMHAP